VERGVLKHSPLVAQDDNKTNKGFAEFQDGAGNPYEPGSQVLEIVGWFVLLVRGA
jgi:hypothetical protein